MKLNILTPRGVYFEGDVSICNVKSQDGELGILENHIPLVTMLVISSMNFIDETGRRTFAISGGMLYVAPNETTILTEAIEESSEIDILRATAAKERAAERISSKAEDTDLMRAQLALQKAITRIQVSQGHD